MKLANAFATFAFVMVGATALAQAPQGQQGPITGRMGPGGASMMQGGMMGQGGQMPMMGMGMMPMMMGGMIGQADYIEGRLAFLKAELKITDAQTPQWNAFADTLRANAKRMSDLRNEMIGSGGMPTLMTGSAPERLERMDKLMSSHLDALRAMRTALQPLYAVLSDDQKKAADALIYGPMGMM